MEPIDLSAILPRLRQTPSVERVEVTLKAGRSLTLGVGDAAKPTALKRLTSLATPSPDLRPAPSAAAVKLAPLPTAKSARARATWAAGWCQERAKPLNSACSWGRC